MPSVPPCRALGSQCHQLSVTLRIGSLDESAESLDHESTWLLGHTAQISFAGPRTQGRDLVVDAVLHVRCRYLKPGGVPGSARCAAHGHTGPMPERSRGAEQPRRIGPDRFRVISARQPVTLDLHLPKPSLPIMDLEGENPCSIAPCATADHRRGSACC